MKRTNFLQKLFHHTGYIIIQKMMHYRIIFQITMKVQDNKAYKHLHIRMYTYSCEA